MCSGLWCDTLRRSMWERLRGQGGQTAAEYLGALLILSVIVAAVSTTRVGERVRGEVQRLVCEIAGGGVCSALGMDEDGAPKLSECVTAAATSKIIVSGEVKVRVYKVSLEGGVEYTRQRRANGQVAMTFKLGTSGGLGATLNDYVGGVVKGGPASSVTFVLGDDAAANRFAEQIKEAAKAAALKAATRFLAGEDPHVDWPPIESVSYEQAGGASGTAEVDDMSGYGEASLAAGYAIGIKRDMTEGGENSGDVTVYYRVNAKAGGSAGLPMLTEGYTGALAGELTLAFTLDRHLEPKKLSLTGTGNWEHGEQDRIPMTNAKAALQFIDGLDVKANERSGRKGEFQIDVTLDEQAERQLALAFVNGVNPVGGPVSRVNAARRLWELVERKGQIQLRHYVTDSTTKSVKIETPIVSGGVAYDTTSAELTRAEDYERGRGFVPSLVCL